MNHHRLAFAVIAATLILDFIAAVIYAHLTRIPILPPQRGPYAGVDWAVATMMTTGDSGPPPLTRAQHWLWLGVHLSIIPLGAASISLFTSGLTARHVKHAEHRIKQHVTDTAGDDG